MRGIFKCRDLVLSTQAWADMVAIGKFRTTLVYRELRGDKLPVAWRKVFYSNLAWPRAIFVSWMLFLGRLNTKERLSRFGVATYGLCCFCGGIENVDHLFFQCLVT